MKRLFALLLPLLLLAGCAASPTRPDVEACAENRQAMKRLEEYDTRINALEKLEAFYKASGQDRAALACEDELVQVEFEANKFLGEVLKKEVEVK